jgi:hypothetical protein
MPLRGVLKMSSYVSNEHVLMTRSGERRADHNSRPAPSVGFQLGEAPPPLEWPLPRDAGAHIVSPGSMKKSGYPDM